MAATPLHCDARFCGAVLLAGVAMLMGCSQQDRPAQTSAAANGSSAPLTVAPTASDHWSVPTDAECQTFVAEFQQALLKKDIAQVNNLIAWDELLNRSSGGVKMEPKTLQQFITGVKIGVSGPNGLAGQLIRLIGEGGSYTCLRVRQVDGRPRPLFRLLQADSTVNYHEFPLAKSPSGKTVATDVYIYATAEYMSQSMRRILLPIAAHEDRSLIQKLTGQESDYVTHLADCQAMTKALQNRQYSEVLRVYKTLPQTLAKDKNVLLTRHMAAMHVNNQEYVQAMDDFRKYYANDPSIDMLSVDYFALQHQYDKSLTCIDALDKALEGDPYLNVLRGNVMLEIPDLDSARKSYERALTDEPTLLPAHWGLVSVSLAEKKFDQTLQLLQRIYDQFHLEFNDLSQVSEYAEFVQSPQYRQWLAFLEASGSAHQKSPTP